MNTSVDCECACGRLTQLKCVVCLRPCCNDCNALVYLIDRDDRPHKDAENMHAGCRQ